MTALAQSLVIAIGLLGAAGDLGDTTRRDVADSVSACAAQNPNGTIDASAPHESVQQLRFYLREDPNGPDPGARRGSGRRDGAVAASRPHTRRS